MGRRGRKTYSPYLDSSMMKRELNRTLIEKSGVAKHESFLTAKQVSDLGFASEPGTLGEGIPIIGITKSEKDKMLKERNTIGVNFHDPYGFTDGYREG